jgi:hypothetical protein
MKKRLESLNYSGEINLYFLKVIVWIAIISIFRCDFSDIISGKSVKTQSFFSACSPYRSEWDLDNIYRTDEITLGPDQDFNIFIDIYPDSACQENNIYAYQGTGSYKKLQSSEAISLLLQSGSEEVENAIYLEIDANYYSITFTDEETLDTINSAGGICGTKVDLYESFYLIDETCTIQSETGEQIISQYIYVIYQKLPSGNRYFAYSSPGENFFPSDFHRDEGTQYIVYIK